MAGFIEYETQDAAGLGALIAGGQVSAVEVLEAAIARAERWQPSINAITIPLYEHARAAAHTGLPAGPLSGVPFLLKDLGAQLTSDFQLHDMGGALADGISQGNASGSQFPTAPLWGIGQRIFFLHDGRTKDLLQAILAHDGEASQVISNFKGLSGGQKQDILNFLRGL
jgi:hypothetical protein